MHFWSAPCVPRSYHLSIYHPSNIWWRLQTTIILLGPKYSPELRDGTINQQRNLSRPQSRDVNICGGMFRIHNFPLHVLGSTRSIRMLHVWQNLTQYTPNTEASTLHRDPSPVPSSQNISPYRCILIPFFHLIISIRFQVASSQIFCVNFLLPTKLRLQPMNTYSTRSSSLCDILIARLFHP
jgi:hypothetical protein